jgi:hypothetical protein
MNPTSQPISPYETIDVFAGSPCQVSLDLQGQNLEEWKVGVDIALGKGDEAVIIVNGFNNTLSPSTQ